MDELKALLRELQKSVDRNHEDIVTAESWARRVWSETGEALKTGFARVTETLPYLRFITKAPRFVLGTIASLAVGGYLARFVIYRKVVDESEKLGKEVEQGSGVPVEDVVMRFRQISIEMIIISYPF